MDEKYSSVKPDDVKVEFEKKSISVLSFECVQCGQEVRAVLHPANAEAECKHCGRKYAARLGIEIFMRSA